MIIIDAEREFGKNYRQKVRELTIKEFADDEVTKKLFDDVCFEIQNGNFSDEEIVDLVKILPSTIAFSIVRSLENREELKFLFCFHIR
jgi:ribosomal protein S25